MNEVAINEIYEKLFDLESKIKNEEAYPIHKKLVFRDEDLNDIYDLLSRDIKLKKGDYVLDAGCGVGYGSCLLAQNHEVNIEGVSLSQSEINQAKKYSEKMNLLGTTEFHCKSFDETIENKYDKIIAVESLKHSLDLGRTLKILKNGLKKNGELYIIEDFYQHDILNANAVHYKSDWALIDVFRKSDYFTWLEEQNCHYIDLTTNILRISKLKLTIKLRISDLLQRLTRGKSMSIYKIFRGGYYLDALYASGDMKYGILKYTNR